MKKILLLFSLVAVAGGIYATRSMVPEAGAIEQGARSRMADDAVSLEQKRRQLEEREAAVAAKEEALRKLSASVDARINELNAAKRNLEGSLQNKKKADEEHFKKMIKLYKSLKPDQAATLMNKLEDHVAIAMLDQMDQRTLVKLIPFLTQPRVIKWTRDNVVVR